MGFRQIGEIFTERRTLLVVSLRHFWWCRRDVLDPFSLGGSERYYLPQISLT